MPTDTRDPSRRDVLGGVLTASAAAVAMWAVPSSAAPQPTAAPVGRAVAPQTFNHSKFAGGAEIARTTQVFGNINALIEHISAQTKVPEQTVHQIISMAYPSIVHFVASSGFLAADVRNRILMKPI